MKGTRYEAVEWFNLAHSSNKFSICEHSRPNKVRVPQKQGVYYVAERQIASQEGLYSTQLLKHTLKHT
jgi:hypothetical protein